MHADATAAAVFGACVLDVVNGGRHSAHGLLHYFWSGRWPDEDFVCGWIEVKVAGEGFFAGLGVGGRLYVDFDFVHSRVGVWRGWVVLCVLTNA